MPDLPPGAVQLHTRVADANACDRGDHGARKLALF